jgi:predicted nucleic acid-binding OB-fold protein
MADIAKIGPCLPGGLVKRTTRCGTASCRCHSDPGRLHGPYLSWIRKVGSKTVTRNLDARQAERYRSWFENSKRLHELVAELESVSAQIAVEAEQWD